MIYANADTEEKALKNIAEYARQKSVPAFIEQMDLRELKENLDNRKKTVEDILADEKKD